MKESYTGKEVFRLLEIIGRSEYMNPDVQDGDKELMESLGYKFISVENNFGGYTKWRLKRPEEINSKIASARGEII